MRCRQGQAPEENGLNLPHYTFTIFIHSKISVNAKEEMRQKLSTAATPQ